MTRSEVLILSRCLGIATSVPLQDSGASSTPLTGNDCRYPPHVRPQAQHGCWKQFKDTSKDVVNHDFKFRYLSGFVLKQSRNKIWHAQPGSGARREAAPPAPPAQPANSRVGSSNTTSRKMSLVLTSDWATQISTLFRHL